MTLPASQYYLLGATFIFLCLFFLYAFVIDHHVDVAEDFSPGGWVESLRKVGLTDEQIGDIKHDDTAWYYKGHSLCIGYGDDTESCPRYENYCAGKKTFGTVAQQARAIKEAIDNNRTHPLCPLLVQGAN